MNGTATALAAATAEKFAQMCELPRMAIALYDTGVVDVVNVSLGPDGVEVEPVIGFKIEEPLVALIDAEDFWLSWSAPGEGE